MMTHKMSSCILFLRAGSDPTSLCLVRFLVLLCFGVFCLFVCLLAFFWFDLFLMGLLTGLCIGPITSAFETIDVWTALHDNLQFFFLLRLNVCNDLAKAMKALDGKKVLVLNRIQLFRQVFKEIPALSQFFFDGLLLHSRRPRRGYWLPRWMRLVGHMSGMDFLWTSSAECFMCV